MINQNKGNGTRRRPPWSSLVAGRLRGLLDWLFGYDYFISYGHQDGKNYPQKLEERLRSLRYRVFLDSKIYKAGDDLSQATVRRVSMSTYLLIVARPKALNSEWVRRELQVCEDRRRTPVVLDINNALHLNGETETAKKVSDRLQIRETLDDPDGDPSEGVIPELKRSFVATRQETWRLRWLAAAIGVFLALLAATGVFAYRSFVGQRNAERQARYTEAERLAQDSLTSPGDSPQKRLYRAVESVMVTRRAGDPPRPSAIQALRSALALNGGRALVGPRGGIGGASFSADGRWVAVTDYQGAVRIWDVANPVTPSRVLRAPAEALGVVASSRDGNRLAVAGMTASRWHGPGQRRENVDAVLVWDLRDPDPKPVPLSGHGDQIRSLAFSPDGRHLASGSEDQTARVWDLDRPGEPPIILPDHEGRVRWVAFSPDGLRVITCDDGGEEPTARVWELSSPSHPSTIDGKDLFPRATLSPDGRWLLHGGEGHSSRLMDLGIADARSVPIGNPEADLASTEKSFSADGRWMASLGGEDSVLVWDLSRPGPQPSARHSTDATGSLVISPDGRLLAAYRGGSDPAILVWDRANVDSKPVELRGYEGKVDELVFNRDGSRLLASTKRYPGDRARAWIWDVNEPHASHQARQDPTLLSLEVYQLALGPDARFLAASCCDESIYLWDLSSPGPDVVELGGHPDYIHTLATTPDGRKVASGDAEGVVRFWDRSRAPAGATIVGSHVADFSGAKFVSALAFNPAGTRLASAGVDRTVQLWDPEKPGIALRTWTFDLGVQSLAFDPSGLRLAAGGIGSVRVCDLSHPDVTPREFKGGLMNSSVAFSARSRYLAANGADPQNRLYVWDLEAGGDSPILLPVYDKAVLAIAFLPDERHLATAELGGVIKLWDLDHVKEGPVRWEGPEGVIGLGATPDARSLIGATNEVTVISWPLTLDDLLDRAEKIAGRNLTKVEWDALFSGRAHQASFPNLPFPGGPMD